MTDRTGPWRGVERERGSDSPCTNVGMDEEGGSEQHLWNDQLSDDKAWILAATNRLSVAFEGGICAQTH
jgi:hypothetical protein